MSSLLREWLFKAEVDWDALQMHLSRKDYVVHDLIVYHAHQAVEKYLKSILMSQKKKVPQSHELRTLAQQTKVIPPEMYSLIAALDPLGSVMRYPGILANEEHKRIALEAVGALRPWAYAYLNETPPDLFAPPDFL